MLAAVDITEKSFGDKILMTGVKFEIDDGEKIGIVGRNGVGKSTLFGIMAGTDKDYSGHVQIRRGASVVTTAQEHHAGDVTVMEYILHGLPEYAELRHVIDTYPATMGDDMRKIEQYTAALDRFGQRGFYQIEEMVAEELKKFQLAGVESRPLASLSGGQKRLIEVVKVMHSDAHMALLDEPTNHMDYVAKAQFVAWLRSVSTAMVVITHDRDVLQCVDRIIEIKNGEAVSYKGNYDAYLRQNAHSTGTAMNEFEQVERRIANLKDKVLQFRRLKERARDPDTIKQFKRRELQAGEELAKLEQIKKPSFWIDRDSVAQLDYKVAGRYERFKARNIRMTISSDASRSKHKLVEAIDAALGYGDTLLFDGVTIDLREGEAIELRGRNGAGKTTLIRALLQGVDGASGITLFDGSLQLDHQVRVGVYEQEVDTKFFELTLHDAIERMYLGRGLTISETKIRQLLADYLFTPADSDTPLSRLSGGQKARFQIIAMLANDPQLLILDEPTNHLDLPSIEELESALERYSGAILYVSHDDYFRKKLGGSVVHIGAQ